MADTKQIHEFAIKWCDKFRDQKINYIELLDHYIADDCSDLGFEMDCGHAFSEKYGSAASSSDELDKIIDDVNDIPLLGSAIYSQWRYFNHWAYSGEEILEPQNRAWFILALSRLAILTGDNPFVFQGEPQTALYPTASAMDHGLKQMTKSSSTLQLTQKDRFGFLHIILVKDSGIIRRQGVKSSK